MTSDLRIALGADGVSIYSSDIFGDAEPSRVRDFLSRTFGVEEVEAVELRRERAFGRIRYGAGGNPAQIWKKLGRALGAADVEHEVSRPGGARPRRVDAGLLYLDLPRAVPVRISRIGDVLSTWRVRDSRDRWLRLSHPVLRNRRDIVFRLEEELAALFGVEEFRASSLTARVAIRFDERATTAERIALELEKAWPRLLEGLEGPPAPKRLVASVGLVGLAYTGQFLVPAVRPAAVAAMTLYSLPNVINGAKQLTRGEVGLSALYSAGLGFMLVSGLPFTASVMAALLQLWPHLARGKAISSQRRLFAGARRLPAWARQLHEDGSLGAVHVEDLSGGARVIARAGEILSVDGRVEDGSALVIESLALGGARFEEKSVGDDVSAGTLVHAGSLTVRVERAGARTAASYVASLLPHGNIADLPSSLEAERIANRNAKPALAVSALTLLLTQTAYPAQGLLRPDYATGPRLSAQLSALIGIAQGFQGGVLFRSPAALDRLDAADVIVLDDSAGVERRSVEVATVQTVDDVSANLVVGYALAAHRRRGEQSRALAAFASKRKITSPRPPALEQQAGVTRYRDGRHNIEIASSSHLAATGVVAPHFATRLVRRRAAALGDAALANTEPVLRPLWVLRDGAVIGVISFTRTGDIVGRKVVAALAARSNRERRSARVVYLARGGQAEARALARSLGIEYRAGLSPAAKAEVIRSLGNAVLWLGDGSDPDAKEAIAASAVSVSVAPLARVRDDAADILLPQRGLEGLPALLALGRAHTSRLARDYRVVYGANLLGVASALSAALSTLQIGLLSNLGTAWIYAQHAVHLSLLGSVADQKRQQLLAPAPA